MAFDYKKEYREFYLPAKRPEIVEIPEMRFVAVRGRGDPNAPDGEYKAALGMLYAVAYTIKMSYMGGRQIEGYFPYVVPPLEGLWWQDGVEGIDFARKPDFRWISMIRLPEFVKEADFRWAVAEAERKKGLDLSKVELFCYREGTCVQCMHLGSYDSEPATVAAMDALAAERGYAPDFSEERRHHEIYLSDPRRTKEERLKTVIRHPVKAK